MSHELTLTASAPAMHQQLALKLFIPWVSFSTGLLVAHPLDTIRVRWQTLGQSPAHTLRHDGVRSLFAGITTPMLVMGPIVAASFAWYESLKPHVAASGLFRSMAPSDTKASRGPRDCNMAERCFTGFVTGAASAQLLCPIFVVRVRQQNSAIGGRATQSLASVATNIVAREGVAGLYRGNLLVTANEAMVRSSLFASYDWFKSAVDATGIAPTRLARDILASCLTACVVVGVSFPFLTLATRVAADETASSRSGMQRIAACYRDVCRPHGARAGLTRGMSIALTRSFLWTSIQMPMYDFLLARWLGHPTLGG